MSRARRLSEIAKSNEPAFNGTYWWLADPSTNPQPGQPSASAAPAEELVPVAVSNASVNGKHAEPKPASSLQASPSHANGAAASASTPTAHPTADTSNSSGHLTSRLAGLKEKFLWLGRKSRSVPQE